MRSRARRERNPDGPLRHDRQEGCLDRPRRPLPTRVEDLPPLPPDFDRALDSGLAELELALLPAGRTIVEGHARLLLAWNASINLTSIRAPADVALRHVVDSLTAVPLLRERRVGGRPVEGFVDLGSGGGFPGIPIVAALPTIHAFLVESVGKKAAFLSAAVQATGLDERATVVASRAEDLAHDAGHREAWPAVTARAVAGLAELVELAFPLLVPGGLLVAWKGDLADLERAAAERAIAALGGGRLESLPVAVQALGDHRLVVVTKGGRAPDQYPRDPAARRRRPW